MAKHRGVSSGSGQDVSPNILTVAIQTKVWLERSGAFVFGEGGLDLLRQIDRLESLTQAARAVGWSYRHAWGYLRNAERQLGVPVIKTTPGKGSTRGTVLTPAGRSILRRLDRARCAVNVAATHQWRRV